MKKLITVILLFLAVSMSTSKSGNSLNANEDPGGYYDCYYVWEYDWYTDTYYEVEYCDYYYY